MIKHLFILILALTAIGCSSNYSSTNQVNDSAFLQLGGNFLNTQLVLDGGQAVQLTKNKLEIFKLNGEEVTRFPITTGKHSLKIIRNGSIIVDRILYVSNSNTFEVIVP